MIKRIILWFRYRKHPCYIGGGEFDHDLVEMQDTQGDGIYSESYHWAECSVCGATHDEDTTVPEFLE